MRDKRTPKDVCGEAKSTLDSVKKVFSTLLGGNRRWVPLILAWYQAPQCGKRAKNGVEYEKYGREPSGRLEVATLSPS